jgi:cold shock CspA family protein
VDSSTFARLASQRSSVQATTSHGTSVDETGTVKCFSPEKGSASLRGIATERTYFVHISAVERSGLIRLSEGDRVAVDIAEAQRAWMW